jgi:hypothetical protein
MPIKPSPDPGEAAPFPLGVVVVANEFPNGNADGPPLAFKATEVDSGEYQETAETGGSSIQESILILLLFGILGLIRGKSKSSGLVV